jgi:exosortase/archaeosortase family protein
VTRSLRPAGRFVATLAIVALVAWLGYRDEYLGPVLVPLRQLTAQAAVALVQSIGLDAVRVGTVLQHPGGFAYEISRGCMGVIPALILTAGVLAWPGQGSRQAIALLVAVPLLLGLNLIRLGHLFYLGVHRPEVFRFAHEVAREGALVAVVFLLWLGATAWAGIPLRTANARSTVLPFNLSGGPRQENQESSG